VSAYVSLSIGAYVMLERHRVKTSFFGMDARYDLQRDMFCLSIFFALKGSVRPRAGAFLF